MDHENIYPAVSQSQLNSNQLTPEEFQSTLYYWFKDKGLVSNIRSYLRMKMIDALKNTAIGGTMAAHSSAVSMEDQAVNILIADYLYHHHYEYTLSVFSTEIPIKSLVSEYCIFIFNQTESKGKRTKLEDSNILCIFELIGIINTAGLCSEIVSEYNKEESTSLLLCVIKVLVKYCRINRHRLENDNVMHEKESIDDLITYVNGFLTNYNIPSTLKLNLISRINKCIENREEELKIKVAKHYENHISLMKSETYKKEVVLKDQMLEMEKQLTQENRRLQAENNRLLLVSENLINKEKRLANEQSKLEQKVMEVTALEKQLQLQNFKTESKSLSAACNRKHCTEDCETNYELIKKLKEQNSNLDEVIKNQDNIIKRLTTKTNLIMSELQSAYLLIRQLDMGKVTKVNEDDKIDNSASSSDIEAPDEATDEIIKETHVLLNKLEKESDKADLRYRNFKMSFKYPIK